MSERIDFIPGNALTTEWPAGQDVVLLSYLLSAVSSTGVDQLLARAFALLIDPDVARLSPGLLETRLRAQGFEQIEHAEVIPGITRSLTAVRRER